MKEPSPTFSSNEPVTNQQPVFYQENQELKKQNGLLKTLVFVLGAMMFLIIGAGGMWFYQQTTLPKASTTNKETTAVNQPTVANPTSTPKPQVQETTVDTVTASWETYSSPKSDYTFKHPSGLKSDTGAAGAGVESIRFTYIGTSQGRKEGMLSDGYSFIVTTMPSTPTAQAQAQKERDQAETSCRDTTNPNSIVSTLTNIAVDKQTGWKFTIQDCLGDSTTIFAENKGNVYRVTMNYPGTPTQQAEYKAVLNQILSTLKFN